MRINVRAGVSASVAVFALLVAGCGNAIVAHETETTTYTTAPTTVAPVPTTATPPMTTQHSSLPVDPAAYDYYVSWERRNLLQEALDEAGMRLAEDMVSGAIPSETASWKDESSPAPYDGYGILRSTPSHGPLEPGQIFVMAIVHFSGGQVDLSGGILELQIAVEGSGRSHYYKLSGATTLGHQAEPVRYGPLAYSWRVDSSMEVPDQKWDEISNQYLAVLIDREGANNAPDWNLPLDPSLEYKITLPDGQNATVTDIKAADAGFLNQLHELKVNSFIWPR